MIAVIKCDKCGRVWTCAAVDEPDVNAVTLTGDQQACPECDSDEWTIIGDEYPEPEYGDFV